jgi:hypothetical protein
MKEIRVREAIVTGASIISLLLTFGALVEAGEPAPFKRLAVGEVRRAVLAELKRRGVDGLLKDGNLKDGELKDGDIEIPSAVPARAGSRVRVASVCWDGSAGRARFRMECTAAGSCLPFFVYVRTESHASAASCDGKAESHDSEGGGSEGGGSASDGSASDGAAKARGKPMVRVGEGATAVMVASGLRMTAAVTCLDRGARGEIIRVRAGEGHIFRARVAGPGLVEAVVSGNSQANSAENSQEKSE